MEKEEKKDETMKSEQEIRERFELHKKRMSKNKYQSLHDAEVDIVEAMVLKWVLE